MSGAARGTERLDALLKEQREALRDGRLEALPSIAKSLEKFIASRVSEIPLSDAAKLHRAATENASLLRAAMSGLADARKLRLGARSATLSTYDASGRLCTKTPSGQTLARR